MENITITDFFMAIAYVISFIVCGIGLKAYIEIKINEWKSNNRVCPPDKEMDWLQANEDIRKKGKNYFHQQHLAGKYDKDKKKY